MSGSDHKKILKQIKDKPGKVAKYKKHNTPKERSTGRARKKCKSSGSTGGVIHKYGLNISRQRFREIAEEIGFKKYS